uniref:G-protein coupled receptors family 1 profile domain-containing protein n=1 Tax=Vombatus ursinus TaxID=29139 RepID=A0A4X2LMU9_VOMUR
IDQRNHSSVTEFVLVGLSTSWDSNFSTFCFFTMFYTAILVGNFLIVLTVISEPALHTPMYFLLSNLSFIDVCLSSFATPKMIADFLLEHKSISFNDCMTQIFFFHVFAHGEMVLLVAMAYDRYEAICKPLHYVTIMSLQKCTGLVVASWVIGILHSLSQLTFTVNLPFYGPNEVDSFFCNLPLVIKLACVDTYILEIMMLSDRGLIAMTSFILLLISYTVILVTVQQHSSASTAKACATLTAHITDVTLFFGPCIFIYAWPFRNFPVDEVLSVFYTVFTPLLNPIIYTLRNKDMKSAMQKLRGQLMNTRQLSQLSLTMRAPHN